MAIFNRNQKKPNNKTAPKEVQKYYASGQRERVGLAWVIAFLSLIATTAVVLGLFFGGRWLWNKITEDDQPTTTTTNQPQSTENGTQPSEQGTAPNQSQQGNNQSGQPSGGTGAPNNNAPGPSQTTTPSQPSTGAPNQSTQNQNQSGKISNTGPRETIAVFVVASVLGTVGHNVYLRRKNARFVNFG